MGAERACSLKRNMSCAAPVIPNRRPAFNPLESCISMISVFSRKTEPRIRRDILRGVYEENLRMLGRGRPPLSRRKPLPVKKIFLSVVVCLVVVLAHNKYVGTSFSPAEVA